MEDIHLEVRLITSSSRAIEEKRQWEEDMNSWVLSALRWWSVDKEFFRWLRGVVQRMKRSGTRTPQHSARDFEW